MNDAQLGKHGAEVGQGDQPIASESCVLIGLPWRVAMAALGPQVTSRGYSTGSVRGPEWLETRGGGRHDRSKEPMQERLRTPLGVYGSY